MFIRRLHSLPLTTMRTHRDKIALEHSRQRIREKRAHHADNVAQSIYFQVIGSGDSRALLLYTDHNRFLFNCPEGLQRIVSSECAPKTLSRLANLCFTSKSWRTLGGLPGLCLSSKGTGVPDVRIHGPEGIVSLFQSVKHFVLLVDFNVISHKAEDEPLRDNNVMIKHVDLQSSGPAVFPIEMRYSSWEPNRTRGFNSLGQEIRQNESASTPIDRTAMAFVITIHGKPGQLDIKKCMELNVPTGPLLGRLKNGFDVELEDGVVVKSSDVVSVGGLSQRCIVVDCPDESYLDCLTSSKELNDVDSPHPISYVFHFTPKAVMLTTRYKSWMSQYQSAEHVLLNDSTSGTSHPRVLAHLNRLQKIAPSLFPSIWTKVSNVDTEVAKSFGELKVRNLESASKIHIRPAVGVSLEDVVKFSEDEIEEEILDLAKNSIKHFGVDKSQPAFPRITFLGTGSSVPSRYRGASGILVEVKPDIFLLLDCGEGTRLQLVDHFGVAEARRVLRNLKAVYVSHIHSDHHLGLIDVVLARNKAFKSVEQRTEKLFIIGPAKISNYLSFYHHTFESVLSDCYQVRNEHLLLKSPQGEGLRSQRLYPNVMKDLLETAGLKQIAVCPAKHCTSSFCLAFTSDSNYKIVYTGDTMPNDDLIELGRLDEQFPDLLIHEATMQNAFYKDAADKLHSTTSDAIEDGKKMGAKYTLLTHFSQRYTKVPYVSEMTSESNVGVAFDHMEVTPQTISLLNPMLSVLEKMFVKEMDYLQLQDLKRDENLGNESDVTNTPESKRRRVEEDKKSQ